MKQQDTTQESPLTSLRIAARLSQQELGRMSAEKDSETTHHQPRISSYELGTKRVPLAMAQKLAKILNARLKAAGSKRIAKIEDMIHPKHR